jgi:hypothetical protein
MLTSDDILSISHHPLKIINKDLAAPVPLRP